jgi:hypothetical protein
VAQRRTVTITEEMLALFRRGCELQAAGRDDVDEDSAEHVEFIEIDKRLNWTLLQLPAHCCSVFDPALDRSRPPNYVRTDHAMHRDWHISQRMRKALMEELEHARRVNSC